MPILEISYKHFLIFVISRTFLYFYLAQLQLQHIYL